MGFDRHWLQIMEDYVVPLQEKVFIGFYQKVKKSISGCTKFLRNPALRKKIFKNQPVNFFWKTRSQSLARSRAAPPEIENLKKWSFRKVNKQNQKRKNDFLNFLRWTIRFHKCKIDHFLTYIVTKTGQPQNFLQIASIVQYKEIFFKSQA